MKTDYLSEKNKRDYELCLPSLLVAVFIIVLILICCADFASSRNYSGLTEYEEPIYIEPLDLTIKKTAMKRETDLRGM